MWLSRKSSPSSCFDVSSHVKVTQISQIIKLVGNKCLQLNKSEWAILDRTPIPDFEDREAVDGYCSKGEFVVFKLHVSYDEFCVPLMAEFTKSNVHGSQKLQLLGKNKMARKKSNV